MDWTAFSLSLQLAAWTVALLLPIAILIARLLAWGDFRGKSVVEALIMLPLVLPPTVLGFYLLVAFSPQSGFGAFVQSLFGGKLVFNFAGILIASLIVNLPFAVQPIQRAFEAIPRNVREAAFVCGLSRWETMRRIELPLAWPGIVSAVALDLRAHAGRVRRHPHDRRQHPGRDARAVDLHLRQRAGVPHRTGGRHVGGAARLLDRCHRHRAHAGAAPQGRRAWGVRQRSYRCGCSRPGPSRSTWR